MLTITENGQTAHHETLLLKPGSVYAVNYKNPFGEGRLIGTYQGAEVLCDRAAGILTYLVFLESNVRLAVGTNEVTHIQVMP